MRRLLVSLALILIAVRTEAQTPRPQISAAQAQQFETALRTNPQDRAARSALLNYYFLNSSLPAAVAIPARRRHILWLIENTPSDELAGTSAATIDAAGHRLADPQGFKLASAAWRAQTAKPDASAAVLANAAYFFKLSDKPFTISLLERAVALEPGNKNISAGLGEAYAMAIMGVTMVNKNGYPLGADPERDSVADRKAGARRAGSFDKSLCAGGGRIPTLVSGSYSSGLRETRFRHRPAGGKRDAARGQPGPERSGCRQLHAAAPGDPERDPGGGAAAALENWRDYLEASALSSSISGISLAGGESGSVLMYAQMSANCWSERTLAEKDGIWLVRGART